MQEKWVKQVTETRWAPVKSGRAWNDAKQTDGVLASDPLVLQRRPGDQGNRGQVSGTEPQVAPEGQAMKLW